MTEKKTDDKTKSEVAGEPVKNAEPAEHVHGPNCNHGHHHHHHAPQIPIVRLQPKVGRNDPCPCGSKQKFKKCCGA